jgi:hypothetical protein
MIGVSVFYLDPHFFKSVRLPSSTPHIQIKALEEYLTEKSTFAAQQAPVPALPHSSTDTINVSLPAPTLVRGSLVLFSPPGVIFRRNFAFLIFLFFVVSACTIAQQTTKVS